MELYAEHRALAWLMPHALLCGALSRHIGRSLEQMQFAHPRAVSMCLRPCHIGLSARLNAHLGWASDVWQQLTQYLVQASAVGQRAAGPANWGPVEPHNVFLLQMLALRCCGQPQPQCTLRHPQSSQPLVNQLACMGRADKSKLA